MTKLVTKIGIDISKLSFDVCYVLENGTEKFYKCENTKSGIKSFIASLPKDCHCVMEATGVYHTKLAYALFDEGISVSVVNPLVIKNYSRMLMLRTKTDKADATLIRSYAETIGGKLSLWEPTEDCYIAIRQKLNTIEAFECSIQVFENQLESITNSKVQDKLVTKELKKQISSMRNSIEKLEDEIEDELNKRDKDLVDKVRSIPGVGKKVSIAVITATKGFEKFENYRQLSSYFGLCPRVFESGSSIKSKAHICKMGMSKVRQLLYCAALSASQFNPACRDLYHRLIAKGKAKKIALVAVANKLIKQIFAIAKSRAPFNKYLHLELVG